MVETNDGIDGEWEKMLLTSKFESWEKGRENRRENGRENRREICARRTRGKPAVRENLSVREDVDKARGPCFQISGGDLFTLSNPFCDTVGSFFGRK